MTQPLKQSGYPRWYVGGPRLSLFLLRESGTCDRATYYKISDTYAQKSKFKLRTGRRLENDQRKSAKRQNGCKQVFQEQHIAREYFLPVGCFFSTRCTSIFRWVTRNTKILVWVFIRYIRYVFFHARNVR